MARAMKISKERVADRFTDGRVASAWTEERANVVFECEPTDNKNEKGFDARCKGKKVSNRTLTSSTGFKAQKSVNIGKGRKCSPQELMDAAKSVRWFVVTDITIPGFFDHLKIPSSTVVRWIENGRLTQSGLRKDAFYDLLCEEYDLEYETVE